jgi:uncharacterized protein (TIGR03437 family)
VSPGYLVAIFGTELASQLTVAGSVPLSTSIADVGVDFNGTAAPIQFVSPGQINAILPGQLLANQESGTAQVTVIRGGRRSQARTVRLARFSPGIYTFSGQGVGPAVVVNNSDRSVAQPAGSIAGVNTRPARVGDALIIYCSGLGPVDPPVRDGAASTDQLRRTVTQPTVLLGGRELTLLFSGLAPDFPGVNQVNALVPEGVPAGPAVPLQIRIGGITTSDQITIAVQN